MELKVIACEVFFREVCLCAATSPHRIDLEFTDKGAHDKSDLLRGVRDANRLYGQGGGARR
jgi:hypothetical protein